MWLQGGGSSVASIFHYAQELFERDAWTDWTERRAWRLISSKQGAVVTPIFKRRRTPTLYLGETRFADSPARNGLFCLCYFSSCTRGSAQACASRLPAGSRAHPSAGIINQLRFEGGHSGSPLSAGSYLGPSVTAALIHTGMHPAAPPVVVIN